MVCDQLLLPAGMLRYRSNASSPDLRVIDLGKLSASKCIIATKEK